MGIKIMRKLLRLACYFSAKTPRINTNEVHSESTYLVN